MHLLAARAVNMLPGVEVRHKAVNIRARKAHPSFVEECITRAKLEGPDFGADARAVLLAKMKIASGDDCWTQSADKYVLSSVGRQCGSQVERLRSRWLSRQ